MLFIDVSYLLIICVFCFQISETFHFDLNSEQTKRMISGHVTRQDISTLSRACIFSITYPSPDVFLVVRVSTKVMCLSLFLYCMYCLTLCRAQCPKTSARGRGQNVPKCPVSVGKLRCFQTRKFPENLVNNNSMRLSLLPPAPFALSLCSK